MVLRGYRNTHKLCIYMYVAAATGSADFFLYFRIKRCVGLSVVRPSIEGRFRREVRVH